MSSFLLEFKMFPRQQQQQQEQQQSFFKDLWAELAVKKGDRLRVGESWRIEILYQFKISMWNIKKVLCWLEIPSIVCWKVIKMIPCSSGRFWTNIEMSLFDSKHVPEKLGSHQWIQNNRENWTNQTSDGPPFPKTQLFWYKVFKTIIAPYMTLLVDYVKHNQRLNFLKKCGFN